jgi:adenine-specific DNA-methyltransferase
MNVEHLGQVFTETNIVERMLVLKRNNGSVLEPSAGDGVFYNKLLGAVGIEIDPLHCPSGCLCIDFFDFDINNKFNTVVGNPPYVAYKNIYPDTKNKLNISIFDKRTNLYLFFIEKCLNHLEPGGEIIFITPRDFLKATSARKLNTSMYDFGTLTHFYETGDEVIFSSVAPNCAIWRFELGNMSHKTETNEGLKNQVLMDGQIAFTNEEYIIPFKELFFVKVGGVSGLDKIFTHSNGNYDFVCSHTRKTGKTKRMFYQVWNDYLLGYKDLLLARKIKQFNENNWFEWGREHFWSDLPRVYVNCKTRLENPFFTHSCRQWDGAVLAVFCPSMVEEEAANLLNKVDWPELGFKVGGRYCFTQRSLENIKLPIDFI